MPNIQDIETKLQNLPWPEAEKTRLAAGLPKLGRFALAFLRDKMKEAPLTAVPYIVNSALLGLQWKEAVQTGQEAQLADGLETMWYSGDYGFGRYLLPALWDLGDYAQNHSDSWPAKFRDMFLRLNLEWIDELPQPVLLVLLKTDLLSWTRNSDLLLDMQRYAYYHNTADDQGWGRIFYEAMLQNKEILGDVRLMVDNKPASPEIKHWLADFVAFSRVSGQARTAFDVVKYLQNAPAAKGLTENNRKLLTEVLKTFNWLHVLGINEKEVLEYEKALIDDYDKRRLSFLFPAPAQSATPEPVAPPLRPSAPSRPVPTAHMDAAAHGPAPKENPPKTSPVVQQPLEDSFNVQDILKSGNRQNRQSGVVFDRQTNVKIEEVSQRMEAERQQKQSAIDQKLEELKKRKHT